MNEATDRRAAQELSRLGYGLAAQVSLPPVTRVNPRATPLRRALVAACSICALGALGATLVLVPGTPNGSIGPSDRWSQHAEGLDSTSQPSASPLIVPDLAPWDAPLGVVQSAVAVQAAAKQAAAKQAAAKQAAAKQAAAKQAVV